MKNPSPDEIRAANDLLRALDRELRGRRGISMSFAVEHGLGECDPVAPAWDVCTDDYSMRGVLLGIDHPLAKLEEEEWRKKMLCRIGCARAHCSACCDAIRSSVKITLADVLSANARGANRV